MIEKTLKTTTGKLTVSIPGNLTEVTLGQMIALQEKPELSDLDAISILSGISVHELQSVRNADDFAVFAEAILSLSYQVKYLYHSDNIPKTVILQTGNRKTTVKVMNNLAIEPAGAFFAAREIIADEIKEAIKQHGETSWQQNFNPSLKACAQVLAHYFFCHATGKPYNEYEAEEFATEIKKLRVTEALPIAKHFFMAFPILWKPKTGFFHRLQQQWRKRQEYRLLKSLNMSTP
jgi:hypothetical protein